MGTDSSRADFTWDFVPDNFYSEVSNFELLFDEYRSFSPFLFKSFKDSSGYLQNIYNYISEELFFPLDFEDRGFGIAVFDGVVFDEVMERPLICFSSKKSFSNEEA